MAKRNGWKRMALIATTIIALGGAWTVLEPYLPWAPKIAFTWAAENKLARLDNQLITLLALEGQAKAAKDGDAVRRLRVMIRDKKREIKEIEKQKGKHK